MNDALAAYDPIGEARRQWVSHELGEPLAMTAAISIIRASQIVNTAVDRALRPLGLSFARYEVLMLLSFTRKGSLPITKIGDRLMVHPTGVSKLVDKLEHQGFVHRKPNPADRRGTLVLIQPAGRRVAQRASRAVAEIRFGTTLPDDQLEQLVDILAEFRRPLEQDTRLVTA